MPTVTGRIGSFWKNLGGDNGPLGPALSSKTKVAGGEWAPFRYGSLWTGNRAGVVLYADFEMPLLGNPLLFSFAQPNAILRVITRRHKVKGLKAQAQPTPLDIKVLRSALEKRFFLKPSGREPSNSTLVPLAIARESIDGLRFSLPDAQMSRIRDRQLYDIVLRLPNGRFHILSPHAVYATRTNWRDFAFIHATDIHVATRIDRFHSRLRRLVSLKKISTTTLKSFQNWNDNFSDFIRYANRLHARQELDFILATGDLVDYLFEKNDRRRHAGGNFAFFKSIVLGQGSSSDGKRREELQVPLFTTLGNHDYRSNPYRLLSKIVLTLSDTVKGVLKKLPGIGDFLGNLAGGVLNAIGIGRVGAKKISKDDEQYGAYNLTEGEAKLLEGGRRPNLNAAAAAHMLRIDKTMQQGTAFYFREFSRSGSYDIDLGGRHRVVMVDTAYDSGFTSDLVDVLLAKYIGIGSSETKKFVRGFINSKGFSKQDITRVQTALRQTSGLVIVGMHAPPLAHAGSEYSHFFRQTEHRRAPAVDTIDFLLRNGGIPPFSKPLTKDTVSIRIQGQAFQQKFKIRKISPAKIRSWHPTGAPFFRKAKTLDDSLAKGVADNSHPFLSLCAGVQGGRKVNLVLCGHKHSNVQYRLRWDRAKKTFEYFLDYFTDNPTVYYNSREFEAGDQEVEVHVKPGLKAPGPLGRVRDNRPGSSGPREWLRRSVPTFADPLDRTTNPKGWWQRHSPLIVQSPSLGPIDKNLRPEENRKNPIEPAFQGIRLVQVRNDIIQRIRLVHLDEMRKAARRSPLGKVGVFRAQVLVAVPPKKKKAVPPRQPKARGNTAKPLATARRVSSSRPRPATKASVRVAVRTRPRTRPKP